MKKLFVVANWKSNKTKPEAIQWLQDVTSNIYHLSLDNKGIIICPPFTLLATIKSYIIDNTLPFKLGAQDVSPFTEGSYTGAVNAKQVKEFADYVIIGHSERQKHFHETEEQTSQKVSLARAHDLVPIFCIQRKESVIPKGVTIVAYEPVFAIGTGNPDTGENADVLAHHVKVKNSIPFVLYGGSVTGENVITFTGMPNIDGVLVGTGSLDSKEFLRIIANA